MTPTVRHAVVPAGGRGTRMLPATRSVPKELLPLGVTPVLDVILAELRHAGLAEIVIVGAPDKPAIDLHVAGDPHVLVVPQPEPRGLGDAVLQAAGAVGEAPFAVALPDALLPDRVLPALLERVAEGFDGAIALEPVPAARAAHYGTARLDADGAITQLVEKAPAEPGATEALAVAARYVLPAATFDVLRRTAPGHRRRGPADGRARGADRRRRALRRRRPAARRAPPRRRLAGRLRRRVRRARAGRPRRPRAAGCARRPVGRTPAPR